LRCTILDSPNILIMPTTVQHQPDLTECLPVYLDALRIDSVLNFDLYIEVQGRPVLYREKNLPFTDRNRQSLLEHQVEQLFVLQTDKGNYQRYIEASLDKIIVDEKIPEPSKAKIIYETSKSLVQELFDQPKLGDNILRTKKMVEHTTSYILRGREAFIHMLQITSFDYYTYTHSINVCTFTIALAQRLGMENPTILHELGIGALLHDIGKSLIEPEILRKKGSLTPAEYEKVKKHPVWGADILRESNLIPPKAYYPVLQHQERLDGSGYPFRLKGHQIHLYGRMTAICDTFDALTTRRVYRDALGSSPALKIIKEHPDKYDEEIVDEFIILMGPSGDKLAGIKQITPDIEPII
jgi:putative nucleotidyltransferase with HDIG domain